MVSFLISRELEANSTLADYYSKIKTQKLESTTPSIWQEYQISLVKVSLSFFFDEFAHICYYKNLSKRKDESLGLEVEGGLGSFDGESTPIFVSSIEPKSSIEKSKYIRVF